MLISNLPECYMSGLLIAAFLVFASCDTGDALQQSDCDAVGGNLLTARVDGATYCAAFVQDAGIAPGFHQIVGISAEGAYLHVLFPLTVGSFDLEDENVIGIGGSYVPDTDGTVSFLSIGRNGSITITELTENRVQGSFEFEAHGYHQDTAEDIGTQVLVTEGVFDVVLTNR